MKCPERGCPRTLKRHDPPAYAMSVCLVRLIDEGYVRDDRATELRERAANLRAGHGFITEAERSADNTTNPNPFEL